MAAALLRSKSMRLETLNALQFSQRPHRWIRYAIGVVVGAEGHLSLSPDSLVVADYNAVLPAESTVLYYHISDEERQKMFPVDPNITRTKIASSGATTWRDQFRDDVKERDGGMCVLTRLPQQLCDAVHLLAHSKGDQYIENYTQRRSRDPTGGDIIRNIDSVRNGLFLNQFTHVALGTDVAFLTARTALTPNFAMTTADIDLTAPPAVKACTTHLFQPDEPTLLGGLGAPPSGSRLRISDNPEWPPPILFDAVYAGAVLHHFGTQTLKDEVAATWKDAFYPGGVMTAAHAGCNAITDERPDTAKRTQSQAQERAAHREEARGAPDAFDMLMTLPYIMVPRRELKATLREAEEKAKATEQRRVQEKVRTWRKQLPADTS
ncbi:hypothetical protein NLJ89_g1358 [Agrocybe chaxingu]|uniref:HNH nuclease domain-containing protein n=1 Tax=Agrocybe chaxingu TaxID=84603 RepID=A0A9W8N076_9AGAR|nr:hypothetical protein NLJ89_g1358 [Agrocybe chaxingu]